MKFIWVEWGKQVSKDLQSIIEDKSSYYGGAFEEVEMLVANFVPRQ